MSEGYVMFRWAAEVWPHISCEPDSTLQFALLAEWGVIKRTPWINRHD